MRAHNPHVRRLDATEDEVGALIDTLAGPGDRLWPRGRPPHCAALEDSLDRAERALYGGVARPARHSAYVRLLRALAGGRARRGCPPAQTTGTTGSE